LSDNIAKDCTVKATLLSFKIYSISIQEDGNDFKYSPEYALDDNNGRL
jgi:hypothetical protein